MMKRSPSCSVREPDSWRFRPLGQSNQRERSRPAFLGRAKARPPEPAPSRGIGRALILVAAACAVFVASLSTAACSKSSDEARPPAAPQAPAAAPAPTDRAPEIPAVPARQAPQCERVAPKAIMEKHCAGCALTEKKAPDGRGVSCRFKGDSIGGEFEFMLVCDKNLATKQIIDESLRQFESMKTMKYERVEGLGRAAVKNGDLQVVFWDDDTPCQATITGVMVKVDFVALAHDLIGSITPAAIE